mmetsp:Transcript_26015/g.42943  ORF Transcript_26015/g.42943 Transcript_26015/m.42943 type:complete len:240 (-) Transcript_26015:250-969(-)|eukprot:CAMPEP_0119318192 /NCGR_PEP_ID=MMETSP1333-20130426/45709_1 /TAXON_ID=418940 /ORGANISM="Scyphosphaera apsteinii, Strain RCC1455" /LENGTH=239 /DNA_ID=CAMNT_0007324323 /DNA_START=90 /DNA_END=809 /DNA_ORIENTATION=+
MAPHARFRLWHCARARSLRVLWMFEELQLQRHSQYSLELLSFPPRQHHKDFLQKNILGTIPWFEHWEAGDVSPRAAMSESCAVPIYLATLLGSPLVVQPSERDFSSFLNWCFAADATLTFPQAITMRYGVFERGRADAAAEDYARWYLARLRFLNSTLDDGREYLCANRFTVADVCVAYALFSASPPGLLGEALIAMGREALSARYKPQTAAYLKRMMERPAFCAARSAEAGFAQFGEQ